MKRSNKINPAQGLMYFPTLTHDAPRLAALVNRHMRNGTAFTTQKKDGLVFSGIQKPIKGVKWTRVLFRKSSVLVKKYTLSDRKADERFYPACMSDSVKVRMLLLEFRAELPSLVRSLTEFCRNFIDQEEILKIIWPGRFFQEFHKWFHLVKRIYSKISNNSQIVTDPDAFAGLLMRGKAQLVMIDFIMKYRAKRRSREFTRLATQFFM